MPFYATTDHVKLYYDVRGKGKPVVFLHGLTASHRHFKKQLPIFSQQFKTVQWDLRGHGDSEVPEHGLTIKRLAYDLREIIEHLELEKVSLVGWSMGTHVIFEYIKIFGCQRLEKIIIIDMSPRLLKADDWRCGLPGLFSRKAGDFGHEDNLFMLATMLDNWPMYSRVVAQRILNKSLYNEKMEFTASGEFKGKEDLPWLYDEAARNTPHVIVAMWIAMSMQDYRPILKEITIPALITYGLESNYYPPENYAYMKEEIPNATVHPFEGCGHALHIQDPEKFNQIAIDFLK